MKLLNYYKKQSLTYDKERDKNEYFKIIEDITKKALLDNIYLNKKIKVLDIGCGTGRIIGLFKNNKNIKAYGIDITPSMLNIAKKKLKSYKNITLLEGNAESLPFKKNYFDVVYSFKTLPHVKDLDKAIKEVNRVSKRNSMIFLEFYNKKSMRRLTSNIKTYTKWHSVEEIVNLLNNNNMKTLKIYGSRTIIPAEIICRIPKINRIIRKIENRLSLSKLNKFSGYIIFVCRKNSHN